MSARHFGCGCGRADNNVSDNEGKSTDAQPLYRITFVVLLKHTGNIVPKTAGAHPGLPHASGSGQQVLRTVRLDAAKSCHPLATPVVCRRPVKSRSVRCKRRQTSILTKCPHLGCQRLWTLPGRDLTIFPRCEFCLSEATAVFSFAGSPFNVSQSSPMSVGVLQGGLAALTREFKS
jgi:hypothetical protein